MIKEYELTLLFPLQGQDDKGEEMLDAINNIIQDHKGKLKDSVSPYETSLGYSIKGQNKALLTVISFSCEPNELTQIEKELKEKKEVLRYFLNKKNLKKVFRFPVFKNKDSNKVELKDIDKKIEEIFNTPSEISKKVSEVSEEEISKEIDKKDESK